MKENYKTLILAAAAMMGLGSVAANAQTTVQAVDENGKVLQALSEATGTVYYNKFIQVDGNWYAADANSAYPWYGVDATEGEVKNVTYKLTDIALAVEGTNMTNIYGTTNGANRCLSGNQADRVSKGKTAETGTVAAGTYTITVQGVMTGKTATEIDVYAIAADKTETKIGTATANSSSIPVTTVIENVELSEGSKIGIKNETSGTSAYAIDYVAITPSKATLALPYDYVTFSYPAALDFSDNTDVEAYAVTVNNDGKTLNLNKVDKAPAGTGLLIKKVGSAATTTITKAESADAIDNNALKPVLTGLDAAAAVADNAWILVEEGFAQLADDATGTIGARKAYLSYDAGSGIANRVLVFDNAATGVANVEAAQTVAGDEAVYTLGGQRVKSASAPGLYIVGGKKFIKK